MFPYIPPSGGKDPFEDFEFSSQAVRFLILLAMAAVAFIPWRSLTLQLLVDLLPVAFAGGTVLCLVMYISSVNNGK